jgi:hypothetical protein
LYLRDVHGQYALGYKKQLLICQFTRVLINLERVGNFGHRADDIVCLGKCDDIVRELSRELGWEQELQEAWEATADSVETDKVQTTVAVETPSSEEPKTKEKGCLQTEVDKLASDVEKSLALTEKTTNSSAVPKEPVIQIADTQKEDKPLVIGADGTGAPHSSKAQSDDGKL